MDTQTLENNPEINTYVGRQPVFDIRQNVWGYELLYRSGRDAAQADVADYDKATLDVVASTFIKNGDEHKRLLINFSENSLLQGLPYAMPPDTTVVQFRYSGHPDLPAVLRKLKSDGYTIAFDDFSPEPGTEELIPLTNMLIIDALDRDEDELKAVLDAVPSYTGLLVAKRLETEEKYNIAKSLGFHLFQGFYFQRPVTVSSRKLSIGEQSRFRLLSVVEKAVTDFDELVQAVQTDAGISYRLLVYLNSPSFGFSRKISSIKQAIVLLGWKQVKHWLRLIILTDLMPNMRNTELPQLASLRARFLQLLALRYPHSGKDPELFFLLGLFSLLDVMLAMTFEDLVKQLPIDEAVTSCLVEGGGDLAPWLKIAKSFERAEWSAIDEQVEALGLDPVGVADAYYDAMLWTREFFESCI